MFRTQNRQSIYNCEMTRALKSDGAGDCATQAMLTLMPPAEIAQSDLAGIVARRNAARRLIHELRKDGLRILALIEKKSHVEPGIHTAEVQECTCRGRIIRRLLVDGRPVEDW